MLLRSATSLCVSFLFIHLSAFSQEKEVEAFKTDLPVIIDGSLEDVAWKSAPIANHFIQNFPNVGAPATQATEVRILYDNSAIYIAAHLYDDPSLIRKQITARDEEQLKDLDYFSVFFDTYDDHQNGFQFLVTSSNVQSDARLGPNIATGFGEYGDKTWDAVWDSKVAITNDGWIVEMKIPYISLRFAKDNVQSWGLQLMRSVRRSNETSFWNEVNPQVNGFVNQFGQLTNLVDVRPPLRLSFSPYVSTGARSTPQHDGKKTEWLRSGGMDVKYGINESFTLDATLVPDFGQVVSDNVVNNLTPYEVRFDEYRPFFTEGTEIFNKSGLFYSRRIGAAPSGYESAIQLAALDPNIEILKNPGKTQLYNAIKLSGRTPSKLGIGVFNAISAPSYSLVRDNTTGQKTKTRTEALTNYNIFVLDQALRGQSYLTFTNTNVIRDGAARDANVSGLDFSLFDKKNVFNVKGYGHYSKVFTASSYDGYNTSLRLGKVSGRIRYYWQNTIRSVNYDPTDLGYLQTNNQHINVGSISYNQLSPTAHLLSYTYTFTGTYRRLYKPDQYNDLTLQASAFWFLKNFWDVTLTAGYLPDQHDYIVLGRAFTKYARRPQYGYLGLSGSSDSRKRLFVNYNFLFADFLKNKEKDYHIIEGGVRYRFSNRLSFDISHRFETETNYITYAGAEVNGDPIIGFVDFKDVTSVLSGIYNFTSRINLTLRVRHYWSKVVYNRFANVDEQGNALARPFINDQDVNFNVFNTDAFFTWDFRYGSRLILGYKNWLGDNETGVVDGLKYTRYIRNLGRIFDLSHGNELTVRFIYFLDYNQLRNKRK
jgi:Domain of unknown function (DUF5916)/Carbohydrate family 9 binding domain-like